MTSNRHPVGHATSERTRGHAGHPRTSRNIVQDDASRPNDRARANDHAEHGVHDSPLDQVGRTLVVAEALDAGGGQRAVGWRHITDDAERGTGERGLDQNRRVAAAADNHDLDHARPRRSMNRFISNRSSSGTEASTRAMRSPARPSPNGLTRRLRRALKEAERARRMADSICLAPPATSMTLAARIRPR